MRNWIAPLGIALMTLGACGDGNPFEDNADTGSGSGGGSGGDNGDGSGIGGNPNVPPGTTSPTPDASIFRSEPTSAQGGNYGDGYAKDISYDANSDTFTVDNLAFDGNSAAQR